MHYTKMLEKIHNLTELHNNNNKSNLIRRYQSQIAEQEVIKFKTLTLAYNYITAL